MTSIAESRSGEENDNMANIFEICADEESNTMISNVEICTKNAYKFSYFKILQTL